MQKVFLILVSLTVGLWSAQAQAHSMCNGPGDSPPSPTGTMPISTSLQITVDADALGVDVTPTGATTTMDGMLVMPVTGGDFHTGPVGGDLEHDGSGIDFEFDAATVSLTDIEFDFDASMVNAGVSLGGPTLTLGVFDIVPCTSGGCTGSTNPESEFGLFLRPQAADVFENVVFGDNGGFDDGDQIALAKLQMPVPEPTALTLLAVSLFAVSGLTRRRC